MSKRAILNLNESLDLAARLLSLAERGVSECQDDGCLMVFGVVRDCAYRIRTMAQKEMEEHLRRGQPAGAKTGRPEDVGEEWGRHRMAPGLEDNRKTGGTDNG